VVPPQGRPFGVQTWDWYDVQTGGWLRWRMETKNPDGDAGWIDTVTEYGLLAKIGLNDRGVGVLLTILHHAADENDETGLPVHLLARRLLAEAGSVEEAVTLARATPVAASTSLTVLDGRTAVGLELFPGGPGELRPDADGLIVRTNHFLSPEGAPGCLTRDSYPSTNVRRDWLDRVLHDDVPSEPADVLAAMRHHDPAGGVCRHPEQALAPELRTATLATVLIAPPEMTVHAGGPCGCP
jgi:isopenicillin-N N-acyltransferase-like protein